MSGRTIVFGLLLPVGLSGCVDAGRIEPMQERVVAEADPDRVLAVATDILQREFGRVRVEPSARRIVTAPVEFTTHRDSGTARDLYRGPSTMRRLATFAVGRRGAQTVARLRVDVERRDTERQGLMQIRGYRLSDAPGQETPIFADAATTSEQNTVWTRVRRDHKLERALLEELRERLASGSIQTRPAETEAPTSEEPTEAGPTEAGSRQLPLAESGG